MRGPCAVALALLAACGGGEDASLPAFAARVPGAAVVVAWPAGPDGWLPDLGPLRGALPRSPLALALRDDVPGCVYGVAEGLSTGWASLAAARPFRDAWTARPDVAADGYAYADLQLLVDFARQHVGESEPRATAWIDGLGLSSLQWAIAALRRGAADAFDFDTAVRTSGADYGVGAILAPEPAGVSLAGDPVAGERLRVELRFDPAAARRTIDAWGSGGEALSMRDALIGVAGQTLREVVAQLDGRASVVVTSDGATRAAFGLRDPDGTRDVLDRFFRPVGDDTWSGPAGLRVAVEGSRLVATSAEEPFPTMGARPFGSAMTVVFGAEGGRAGRVEAWRADERTLMLRGHVD